jgi:hypothetical protein
LYKSTLKPDKSFAPRALTFNLRLPPRAFQYQGSKQALAALILQYLAGPDGAGRKYLRFNWHITDIRLY